MRIRILVRIKFFSEEGNRYLRSTKEQKPFKKAGNQESGSRTAKGIRIRIRIRDPDPAIVVVDLQDASKKLIF
jgi:hypothetical protein